MLQVNIFKALYQIHLFAVNTRLGFLIVKTFFDTVVRICERVIPKNKSLVVFGTMNGLWYGDHSKRLYEYIIKNVKGLECCWLTNNYRVYRTLKTKKLPVALAWSPKGIKKLFEASVGCYTNTLRDISIDPLFVSSNIKLVALRHGKSVKAGQYALKDYDREISRYGWLHRKREHEKIEFAISTSPLISEMQESMLRIGLEKHIVTGYPRLDNLLEPDEESITRWKTFIGNKYYSHIILYAPTWRNGLKKTEFFPFGDFDPDELNRLLKSQNALLLLRPHINDLIRFAEVSTVINRLVNSSLNICSADHTVFQDVYSLLPFVSVLISDYSALYHDFLLLDRPIFLVPYDYDWYKENIGLLYDYKANMPGGEIKNFQDMKLHLTNIFKGIDSFVHKRKLLGDKIHAYKDANSSERVTNEIKRILTN